MKKYNVIYADPPWNLKAGRALNKYTMYNNVQVWSAVNNKSRGLSFPSMSISEISQMCIRGIAHEDCHLYMWATNRFLPDAFSIINSWGFKYSTTIVWCKQMMGGGLGGSWKINTEFLLFATRGKLKATGKIPGTWHNVKRDYKNGYPQHSKKPEYFRKLIEVVSPGNRIELFARHQTKGWDVHGNEVNNSITI